MGFMTNVIEKMTSSTISNSIFSIRPYWTGGTWAFDAPEVGLIAEPFVSGADTILSAVALHKLGVTSEKGSSFTAFFSANPFPDYDVEFKRLNEEYGGYWYEEVKTGAKGWLCPATLKFFPAGHPTSLFLKVAE